MKEFVERLDRLAGIEPAGPLAAWLERIVFGSLILMVLSAPHSIAATQSFWLFGMVVWLLRFAVKPRPRFIASFLALPLIAFFGWSVISSAFSYAPDISFGRLRNTAVLAIFFFVLNNLRNKKAVKFVAKALIFSCMVNVLWMPVERLIGRGVKIRDLRVESPLKKAGFADGDTLFYANDKKLTTPGDLVTELERSEKASVRYYRSGDYWQWDLKGSDLLAGDSDLEKLGIGSWSKSSSWRSSGFYGHYATYAEVLQLVGSLTFGLLIACLGFARENRNTAASGTESKSMSESVLQTAFTLQPASLKRVALILMACVAFIALAMLLTFTRAPQAGLMVSGVLIVLAGGSRKVLFMLLLIILPVAAGAVIVIQNARGVGFVDLEDGSTSWRLAIYREGIELWSKKPRNIVFGVGMDSIKRFKEEWHLFGDGRLQIGHFHSTPVQILVERGLPGLLLWFWIFGAFLRKILRSVRTSVFDDWLEKGILLGSFGGVCGFLFSSLVHYNFGDEEVIMILYFMMAMAVRLIALRVPRHIESLPAAKNSKAGV